MLFYGCHPSSIRSGDLNSGLIFLLNIRFHHCYADHNNVSDTDNTLKVIQSAISPSFLALLRAESEKRVKESEGFVLHINLCFVD